MFSTLSLFACEWTNVRENVSRSSFSETMYYVCVRRRSSIQHVSGMDLVGQ